MSLFSKDLVDQEPSFDPFEGGNLGTLVYGGPLKKDKMTPEEWDKLIRISSYHVLVPDERKIYSII